jgi:hypothetical protein
MVNDIKRSPAKQVLHKVEISQNRTRSSGKPTQKARSPSQSGAAEKSTGGSDSPAVRNLSIKVTAQGDDNFGILPQGASNSSKLMEGRDLKLVASMVGRLHLEKTKLSGNTRRKSKN